MLGLGVTCNLLPVTTVWWTYIGIVFRWIRFTNKKIKIVGDIITAVLVAIVINCAYALIFTFLTGNEARIDWSGTLLNDLLVLMLIEMAFYFKSLILSQSEVEYMRQQVVQHQYEALKAQVNPHFLFNSFNLLYSLILIDTNSARTFVQNLAEMYRYILDRHGRNRVSAAEEIAFINSYIGVLTTRYRNKFSVTWTGLPADSDFLSQMMLVPFSLQILIENTVKHNVVSSRTPMSVEICIEKDGIRVINPLQPRQTSSAHTSGFGLRYLKNTYDTAGRIFHVINNTQLGIFEVYMEWLKPDINIHRH